MTAKTLLLRPWLARASPTAQMVVSIAQDCVGYQEDPPGSNRGPEIDALCDRAGIPRGSYWCAAWAGQVWLDAGLAMPTGYPSCDAIKAWGRTTSRWSEHTPSVGAFVLYGTKQTDDASHIGIIIRVTPQVESLEGNTTVEGAAFERNGTAVATKLVTSTDPVLGYVHILPLPTTGVAA